MKRLFMLPLAVLLCNIATAQFNYSFKDTTTTYVPLTGGTSLNGGNLWYANNYVAPMPFSWMMNGTIPVTGFPLALSVPGLVSDTGNFSDLNGFLFGDMDIIDRGALTTSSRSPITYATSGTTPNRIFKLELANVGFTAEYTDFNTFADSFNLQVWVYETSNIVELHYGSSRVSHPGSYFGAGGTGPFVSYMAHVDLDNGTAGEFYYIKGSASAPGIDSVLVTASNAPTNILNAWPASGEVFRFTPKFNCAPPVASFTSGTPSGKTVQYTYTGTTALLDSLVWNFGDGQKQKVTSGFTTPVTHTFASNGRYSVTTTAYNACGKSTAAAQQTSLAVSDIPGLGYVKVYPNPAKDVVVIEGMMAGCSASVYSMLGQEVMRTILEGGRTMLSVAALPAGIYRLLLTSKDGVSVSTQFIKQ